MRGASELLRLSVRLKRVTRFVAAFALLALAALLAACGGGGSPAATPSATPAPSTAPTLTPLVAQDEAWLRGLLAGMSDGRGVDGALMMDVQVTDDLGGQPPGAGDTARVFVACSFCIPVPWAVGR